MDRPYDIYLPDSVSWDFGDPSTHHHHTVLLFEEEVLAIQVQCYLYGAPALPWWKKCSEWSNLKMFKEL
jgi:hypothetical protein